MVDALESGATALALDSRAACLLTRSGISFSVADDWLNVDDSRRLLDAAREFGSTWYAPARWMFEARGVCLPELDEPIMHGFWLEYALQFMLTQAFLRAGVTRLSFFCPSGNSASIHRSAADTYGSYWRSTEHAHLIATEAWRAPASASKAPAVRLLGRAGAKAVRTARGIGSLRSMSRSRRLPPTDVVVLLGDEEAHRLERLVSEVTERRGAPLVCVLEPDIGTAAARSRAWKIAVLPAPAGRIHVSRGPFHAALDAARASASGAPYAAALSACPFHFSYYAEQRWPRFGAALDGWSELWATVRPKVIVRSSLSDPRYTVATAAARASEVTVIAAPHASFYVPDPKAADAFLCGFPLQRAALQLAGVPANAVPPCRIYPDQEATASRAQVNDQLRVLVLTNAVSEDRPGRAIADHTIGHRAQLTALNAIRAAMRQLHPRLDVRFRCHPLHGDVDLLEAADKAFPARVVDPRTPLLDAAAQAHLVLAVNYVGSAIRELAHAGLPLVQLRTSPLLSEAAYSPFGYLLRSGLTTVASEEDLTALLGRILTDGQHLEALRVATATFASAHLRGFDQPVSELLVHDPRDSS